MLSFVKISALSLLLSRVAAQGGKPSSIVGFEPLTDVRDQVRSVCMYRSESFVQTFHVCLLTLNTTSFFPTQARIDLDQKDINDLLEDGDFENAKALYEEGSHSKSVSTLTVSDGLPVAITQGANITGTNDAGESVRLFAQASNYTAGATEINVQYKDEGCYVGASTEPNTTGCTYMFSRKIAIYAIYCLLVISNFRIPLLPHIIIGLAASGTLTLDDNSSFAYTYEPKSTFNVYSIQLFTNGTEYKFDEQGNFTTDFQKFVDFYGELHVQVCGWDQWMYCMN
jgi:hypothetical protein